MYVSNISTPKMDPTFCANYRNYFVSAHRLVDIENRERDSVDKILDIVAQKLNNSDKS